jgi:hypothetical protein
VRRVLRALGCAVAAALLALTPTGALPSGQEVPRPDPQRTPGATDPVITQDKVDSTICRSGYTRSVRHVTLTTKRQVFTEYRISYAKHRDYEVDHLTPLELGGSNDVRNLWPEPYQAATGARAKDEVENALHALVCDHRSALIVAQLLIANDWTTAVQTITATPGTIPGAAPPTPTTTPEPTSGQPSGPTAICNDGSPSYSQHRRGTCSHHGGVREYLVPLPGLRLNRDTALPVPDRRWMCSGRSTRSAPRTARENRAVATCGSKDGTALIFGLKDRESDRCAPLYLESRVACVLRGISAKRRPIPLVASR